MSKVPLEKSPSEASARKSRLEVIGTLLLYRWRVGWVVKSLVHFSANFGPWLASLSLAIQKASLRYAPHSLRSGKIMRSEKSVKMTDSSWGWCRHRGAMFLGFFLIHESRRSVAVCPSKNGQRCRAFWVYDCYMLHSSITCLNLLVDPMSIPPYFTLKAGRRRSLVSL